MGSILASCHIKQYYLIINELIQLAMFQYHGVLLELYLGALGRLLQPTIVDYTNSAYTEEIKSTQ